MVRLGRRHIPALMLVLSAVTLIVAAPIIHIGREYLFAPVLGLLLFAAFSFVRVRSNPSFPEQKVSGFFLMSGLIFLLGAGLGLVSSLNGGWEWIDLVPLTIATSIGVYLLWLGIRRGQSSGRETHLP